jgi:type I restriction enzyme S subunit
MKFPAYPKYKPSGVEWLGDVPDKWDVKRLKYSVTINDEALPETTDPDFEFRYVDIGGVDAVNGIVTVEEMIFENAPSRARRIVRNGDTIVSTVRTYLRAIAPIKNPPDNLIVSTGFAVVRPRSVRPDFLSYALRESSFIETVVARSTGVSYPAVNASEVGIIPIPLPPAPEQQSIADFLDSQTARLDALLAKRRALIEKLQEKRTALISRTVTRGLNPNAKLKPSGVEWLGDVPEHWELKKFGYISAVVRGASPRPAGDSRYFDGDFMPWITVGEVTKDKEMYLTATETMLTEEGVEQSRIMHKGTLVLTNSGATLGVPKILSITGCANDGVVAFLHIQKNVSKQFLYYYLSSLTENLRDRIKQGSGQPNLNTDIIKALAVPIPPTPKEQDDLVEYLNGETAKINRMVEKVEAAIKKLQEYRTALIAAAVTGKIDVRKAAA